MRTLTLVILCLMLSCRPETDPNQVEFRIFNNIPVVQATINGKTAMFILDTGASLTVLNRNTSANTAMKLPEQT